MREHPIIFSAPMVRAILEDRKTQTRRVVKGWQPKGIGAFHVDTGFKRGHPTLVETTPHPAGREIHWLQRMPYGQPGDRLWVREACRAEELTAEAAIAADYLSGDDVPLEGLDGVRYLADNHFKPIQNAPEAADAWGALNAYRGKKGATVPSIHMPRWASRITLELTDVRVERVQDISESDARAEGVLWVPGHGEIEPADLEEGYSNYLNCREGFQVLWDSTNAKRGFGWNANPWVWALTFRRVEQSR